MDKTLFNCRKNRKAVTAFLLCAGLVAAHPLTLFAEEEVAHVTQQQKQTVTGVVKDMTGEPVIGANVREKGNPSNGTITDLDGKFSLKVTPDATLEVSFIGYKNMSVKAVFGKPLNLVLQDDTEMLDEVVVVGYGTMRKKDLTGSVIQIKPDKIAVEAPKSVQDVLRGTPGLTIGLDTSAKGGGSMRIRGVRSVSETSLGDPLLILDGVPFYGELSEINPEDIGQIDVLKDASAAAVYGAKAANGVIIITTKKGKQGKPTINFRANFGFDTKAIYPEVFSPDGYMQYREDWYKTPTYGKNPETGRYEAYQAVDAQGKPTVPYGYYDRPDRLAQGVGLDAWRAMEPKSALDGEADLSVYARRLDMDDVILQNYLNGRSFDWYDYAFRTGFNQDYNVSVSGAGERVNYYLSAGYSNNESSILGDDYSAVRANMKISGKITDWLEISSNVNFQDRTDQSLSINVGSTLDNSPYANYVDEEGNLAVHPMGDKTPYFKGYNYDFEQQYIDYERGYTTLNTIFTAKLTLPFNITYSFNVAPRYQFFYNRYFTSSEHPDRLPLNSGTDRGWSKNFDWSLNNTINWDYTFANKHHVNVTLVQEAEEFRYWYDEIKSRKILPSDALGFHNTQNGDKNSSSFSTNDTHQTATGLLGRLFYSYDDRYMITTSVRRDGYSAFGQNNPYATFPSVALAWSFTNEKFFNWKPMNYGKLRLSWGKNGNRSLKDPYISLSNLRNGTNTYAYLDASGNLSETQYVIVDRLASPNLQWEKSAAFNVGLDFGFLNNRITGSLETYVINTEDMIMAKQLPGFTGFGSIATNLGEVRNSGFELSLSTQNFKTDKFEWSTTFNFAYNHNEIKHLYYEYEDILDDNGKVIGTKERDEYGVWFIGRDINTIWNYRVTGIWQADEAEEAKKYGQLPGDPKVANNYTADDKVNEDGTTTPVYNDKDKEFLGVTTSPVHWQMRNSFTLFKDFDFSFNIYSYMGAKYLDTSYLNNDNGSNVVTYGANRRAKEYWTPDNPSNEFARLNAKGPNGAEAPGRLMNKNFIRLENISLSYRLPKSLVSKWSIQNASIYGTIRNVAVWSKDKHPGGDPETGGFLNRVYTVGLNVTF